MRLTILAAIATALAAPAFAQSVYPDTDSDTVVVTPPAHVYRDEQVAAADTARQNYYQHKLDEAQAQARIDNALADRDAAQAAADADRDRIRDADDDR